MNRYEKAMDRILGGEGILIDGGTGTEVERRGVPLLNIMHTDVRHVDAGLGVVDAHWDGIVGVHAHSGHCTDGKWIFEGTISPDEYTEACESWLDRNVQAIGGCCGIRLDHIANLSNLVEESFVR